MGAIDAKQVDLETARAERARAEAALSDAVARARGALATARSHAANEVDQNTVACRQVAQGLPVALTDDWSTERWADWDPTSTGLPRWLRIGALLEGGDEIAPALIPFIGSHRPLVIRSRGEAQAEVARSLLQAITTRIAVLLPHGVNFYLVDPAREGRTFPMSGDLSNVMPRSGDVRGDLERLFSDCARITTTYPDAPLDRLPDEIRLTERFNLVVAADFPRQYDSRAIEAIHRVARLAPAGALLVVHHDLDADRPGEFDDLVLDDAYVLDATAPELELTWHGLRTKLRLDTPPEPERSRGLLGAIRDAAPSEPIVPFTTVIDAESGSWWQEASDKRIEAHVGRAGASGTLAIVFGVDAEGRPRAHAAQAAGTGAGKSTLFHTLITSLATRYSPDELRLYLIDGKNGSEFQLYTDLPHAEVVSLQTPPELARSVVTELVDEMDRRHALFQDAGLEEKVRDFPYYRDRVGSLPRLLLIVDEYQDLFEGDDDGVASSALIRLAEKGRSAGVHVYIASQGFSVPGLLHRDSVFRNVHTRVALEMSQEEVTSLSEFGSGGRALIRSHCTHVGRAVVNSRGGADDANSAGKVALLTEDDLATLLPMLRRKADETGGVERRPIVFRGGQQPALRSSPVVSTLLTLDDRSPTSLEAAARRPWALGGFDQPHWLAAESPLPLLLGRELSVRGGAIAVLERRSAENVVFVGANPEILAATATSALASAALSRSAGGFGAVLLDSLPAGGSWTGVLETAGADLLQGSGHSVLVGASSIDDHLATIEEEIVRRSATADAERGSLPSILLVGLDLDRVGALVQIPGDYGPEPSELGSRLQSILDRGPALGVHTWLGFRSVASLEQVLPERSVRAFRHRVALQISEDDSFSLFGNSQGASVQGPEPRPVRAIYLDTQRGEHLRFLPHTTADQPDGSLASDLASLRARMGGR